MIEVIVTASDAALESTPKEKLLVRCKDCKWWTTLPPRKWAVRDTEGRFTGKYEMIQTSFCNYGVAEEDPYNFTENDFCSRGERK